jgi:hypothetical protein
VAVRGARCLAGWVLVVADTATQRRSQSDETIGAKVCASFSGSDRSHGAGRQLLLVLEDQAYRARLTDYEAKADLFDNIERFYNEKRRGSTIGYLSPGVRTTGRISLSGCQQIRVQAKSPGSLPRKAHFF